MEKQNRTQIREEIKNRIELKNELESKIFDLQKQDLLLSDEDQWFEEKVESVGRGRTKRNILIARVYFKQNFPDKDTGKDLWVTRNKLVKADGVWQYPYEHLNNLTATSQP